MEHSRSLSRIRLVREKQMIEEYFKTVTPADKLGKKKDSYKSILTRNISPATSRPFTQVGINPNFTKANNSPRAAAKIFPDFGLYKEKDVFKTSGQFFYVKRDNRNVDKRMFRKKYFEKEFMEEALKAKNMASGKV